MDEQQAAACGRWRDAGRHTHPGTAGGGSRVHTYKQLLQPNIHAGLRPLRAAVYASKREPSRLKATSRHGFGPCNFSCVVCDLMAWGSGDSPSWGGPMGPPDRERKPESWSGVRG
jgi:hypothetical protein